LKKKDINPLFLKYESITFDINDFTKPNKVLMYAASGKQVLENGVQMFEIDYEPLFEENEYLKLLKDFDESPLLINLFKLMSFNYFTFYSQCICWYSEISKVNGAFNLKELVEKYESKKVDDYSCPVLKYLDLNLLDNINFYKNINTTMRLATLKNIKSINFLLYGKKNPKFKESPTTEGKLLLNSVLNIVYNRFLKFLKSKNESNKSSSSKRKKSESVTASSLALFCSIIHQSGIIEQGFDESAEDYCERVLRHFSISGNAKKVRTFYNKTMDIKETDDVLQKVIKLIMPMINNKANLKKIRVFINNKTKMYV
jgi:hypothetical protein